jgi:hypothetical protein
MRRKNASPPKPEGLRFVENTRRFRTDGDLTAGEKAQVADAPFHGCDPAVERFGRRCALAPEIVGEIQAIGRLQLKRRFIDL